MNKIYYYQQAYKELIRHSFYMESKYYNGKLLFLNFLMVQTNIMFTEIITGKHRKKNFCIFRHTICQVVDHQIDNKGLEKVPSSDM